MTKDKEPQRQRDDDVVLPDRGIDTLRDAPPGASYPTLEAMRHIQPDERRLRREQRRLAADARTALQRMIVGETP